MEIRELHDNEIILGSHLRAECWPEECAGIKAKPVDVEKDSAFFMKWRHEANKYNDVRLMLGAFEEGTLLGVAYGSFAEEEDSPKGYEINGLWVTKNHRGRGLSKLLLSELNATFYKEGKREAVAYNHTLAPSNAYYKYLGFDVVRQVKHGEMTVDILLADINQLNAKL